MSKVTMCFEFHAHANAYYAKDRHWIIHDWGSQYMQLETNVWFDAFTRYVMCLISTLTH